MVQKNLLHIQNLRLNCIWWWANRLAGQLTLPSRSRLASGGVDRGFSPRLCRAYRWQNDKLLTFGACSVESTPSSDSALRRWQTCRQFSQTWPRRRESGGKEGDGGFEEGGGRCLRWLSRLPLPRILCRWQLKARGAKTTEENNIYSDYALWNNSC